MDDEASPVANEPTDQAAGPQPPGEVIPQGSAAPLPDTLSSAIEVDPALAGPGRRRRRTAARGALALLVLAAVGATGVLAGAKVAERNRAADPGPSAPPVVTVPVESQRLVDLRELDCTARRGDLAIAAAPSYGGESPVVTAVKVANGRQVDAGDPVVEVSGRPVIALPGRFPLYRDLHPGDTGVDVRQLQEALSDAGYDVGVDGTFGPRTTRAVQALYRHAGYPVATQTAAPPQTSAGGPAPAGTVTARPTAPPPPTLVVPKAELVMLPRLPARKTGGSGVGTVPTTRLFAVENTVPAVSCTAANSDGIAAGQTVTLTGLNQRATVASLTTNAAGTPSELGPGTPMDGSGRSGDTVRLSMNESALGALPTGAFTGQVVVAQTTGPVAVVPLAAVGGSSTHPKLTVRTNDQNRQVDVTLGLEVDGIVEVRAAKGGDLRVGDDVVITG